MKNKIRLICIAGPTASGKTSLGVYLAERFSGEVVSADSMQIYKGMPIASAVPDESEKRGIPHHLMEFLDNSAKFTVADYIECAHRVIKDIVSRGKVPIIVGGTGLYIDSLLSNVKFVPQKTDDKLREQLIERAQRCGYDKMLEDLRKIDPSAAEKLHPNDKKRIIRAFEIYEGSGITKTEQNVRSMLEETPYDPIMLGVTCASREKLYERINSRVDLMLENGLLDEAQSAFQNKNFGGGAYAIGHKEFFAYFNGEIPLEEAVENLKTSTRRYAKRQLTWFRKNEKIHWLYSDTEDIKAKAVKIIEEEGL